ncbi:MAG: TetR/AcrR family transcriptional regulator [Rikenellaceae bacterium]|nr:TetR/AcrR family transcriptional regulator [Rikenellaceae bacterium]
MARQKKEKIYDKSSSSPSTRRIILDRSREIINRIGAADFKIDVIAGELELSPGNITYHFSRKDDICIALWEELMDRLDFNVIMSKMLDLKQLFLALRAVNGLLWDYRGVVMSRGGDVRLVKNTDDADEYQSISRTVYDFFTKAHEILRDNGYIRDDVSEQMLSSVLDSENIILRSWLNYQTVIEVTGDGEALPKEEAVNRGALMAIYSMYPLFSEKAKADFKEISDRVYDGKMNI